MVTRFMAWFVVGGFVVSSFVRGAMSRGRLIRKNRQQGRVRTTSRARAVMIRKRRAGTMRRRRLMTRGKQRWKRAMHRRGRVVMGGDGIVRRRFMRWKRRMRRCLRF
jgi:hypothetical protein